MLLFGQFNYGKAGVLDRTHTRLFTFRSLRHLLVDAGIPHQGDARSASAISKVLGDGVLGRTATAINQMLIRVSRSMFLYQIFVIAEATPAVDFILEDAKRRSETAATAGGG